MSRSPVRVRPQAPKAPDFIEIGCFFYVVCADDVLLPSACRAGAQGRGLCRRRVCGHVATIILLVYFAQLTTVRFGGLTEQARILLDFRQMNLFFSFDLLGYALMSLATFFAGLTVCPRSRTDRWLRALLLIHGVFFISCLLMPMLGVFRADRPAWIGTAVLEFWCAYFCPVAVLSRRYFQSITGRSSP